MKHVFSVVGVGLAAAFVAVFFTGRVDSKHLTVVAPRVGMHPDDLDALVPRIAAQTGATLGTSRRVVYLLACSGMPTSATMEAQAREAATITAKQRMTARQAAVTVLSGDTVERPGGPLRIARASLYPRYSTEPRFVRAARDVGHRWRLRHSGTRPGSAG